MAVDWQAVRAQFPALSESVWLNTATFGQVPLRAQQAIQRHYEERNRMGARWFLRWFEEADAARADIAGLFGVDAEDFAYIPNANHALSLLVNAIDWRPGDEILSFENEFPNQTYAVALVAHHGVKLRVVKLSEWQEALTDQTRLVSVSQTNYATGEEAPVDAMNVALRRHPALLYVDGTQTAGARKLLFPEGLPDLYAVNGYKWMNSPPGAAFALIPAYTRAWLRPQTIGWRSDRNWRNVSLLSQGMPEFADSADRYEGGMLPIENIAAMRESALLVREIGIDVVEERVMALAAQIREVLTKVDATFIGSESGVSLATSHIVSAKLPEPFSAETVVQELDAKGVQVSARHGYLRVSAHYYNNEQDIERFASVLRSALGRA